jgi:transaldolase
MTPGAPLSIKIFADGANRAGMIELARDPMISGLTTNPTLMHQAGVRDYESFARDILQLVPDLPISFEVFADDFDEMVEQALRITSWGDHVYVKIPVTDTEGRRSARVISSLAEQGVKLNVTALMTGAQVEWVSECLAAGASSFLSVFAGRIADTGRDPIPIMKECLRILEGHANLQLIWASPRELLNIVQADQIGCHIITVTHGLFKKLPLLGKDLTAFSLDTVRMFHDDARSAGFQF